MRFAALLPAAGSGSRMAASTPKQYLPLLGEPMLLHTLRALHAVTEIDRLLLVISAEDEWFEPAWLAQLPKLRVARVGGATRAESVRNGLRQLTDELSGSDWVLVHDAARPCIDPARVTQMIAELRNDPVGGLLALPLADTLKRADSHQRVASTVPREGLWRAQTPQMFRHGQLLQALEAAADASITDEASAIEQLGQAPRLLLGDEHNLKVTYPDDLALATRYLQEKDQ